MMSLAITCDEFAYCLQMMSLAITYDECGNVRQSQVEQIHVGGSSGNFDKKWMLKNVNNMTY